MADVFISLGSNMGDRVVNIESAISMIQEIEGVELANRSSLYETEPWGLEEQDSFLNMCIKIETDIEPKVLLAKILDIELKLGRERTIRWGPRTIDIDILVYGDLEICDKDLQIPHPRMTQRAFVLVPLKEIENELIINGMEIDYWLGKVSRDGVVLYSKASSANHF